MPKSISINSEFNQGRRAGKKGLPQRNLTRTWEWLQGYSQGKKQSQKRVMSVKAITTTNIISRTASGRQHGSSSTNGGKKAQQSKSSNDDGGDGEPPRKLILSAGVFGGAQ